MDTKKLEIFLKSVEAGSLRKAAEEWNYTQSAVSYLIRSLEDELDLYLIARSNKGVYLTPEGEKLVPLIQKLIKDEKDLLESISNIKKEAERKLLIGTYPIYAECLLPYAISQYTKGQDKKKVDILVRNTSELLELLKEEKIHFAIGEKQDILMPDGEWILLHQMAYYAAIPTSFDISEKESVTVEELQGYPILFSSINDLHKDMEKHMGEELQHKIHVEIYSGHALLLMAAEQLGIAFLSSNYLRYCPEQVRMVPLTPGLTREVGVAINTKSEAKREMIDGFIPYLRMSIKKNENEKRGKSL